jgi:hypothetical protein
LDVWSEDFFVEITKELKWVMLTRWVKCFCTRGLDFPLCNSLEI